LEVKDTPTANFEFTKVGNDGITPLVNCTFTLTRDKGDWADKKEVPAIAKNTMTSTSGSDGKVNFTNLDPGTYTLAETAAPAEYFKTGTYTVTVSTTGGVNVVQKEIGSMKLTGNGNESSPFKIQNTYANGTISIKKVDAELTTLQLSGAVFELYDGLDQNCTGTAIQESTSGSDGVAIFKNIPYSPNGYNIKEKTAPTGYVLNSEIVTLTAENLKNNNQPFAFTVEKNYEDTRVRGSINLTKKNDAKTAQTMKKRQFELTYTDNDGYTAWQSSIKSNNVLITISNGKGHVTTDDSGKIALTDVPYGNYRLTEVFPPDDQYQGPKTIEITRQEVITGSSTTAVEKELINTLRKASLTIEKTDTKGDHMPDVTFKLSGTNAYKEPYENKQVTSSTNGSLGKVTFNEIPIGTYTLEETQIGTATADRDGYEALKKYDVKVESSGAGTKVSIKDFDAQDNVYIDLTIDKNNTYSIKNTPVTGEIKFTKKDSDGRDLTKMTFKLQQIIKDMNGGVTDGEAISMNQEDSTGSTICFKNVPYGNYKLVEETKQGVKSVDVGQILKADLAVTAASGSTPETFTYQPSGTTTPPVVTNELNKANIHFTKINENGTTITEPITFKVLRRGTVADNAKSTFVLDVPTTTTNYTAYKDALNNPVTATTNNGVLTVTGLVMGDYQLSEHLPNNAINQGADIVKVTFTVDAQGEISKLSKYDLATSALKPVTPITEEIKAGDLGTVVNNIRYGYVNLLKTTNEANLGKIKDATFDIYRVINKVKEQTAFVTGIKTDGQGNLIANNDGSYGSEGNKKWLVYGDYILQENVASSQYKDIFNTKTTEYNFSINEGTTGHQGTVWISTTKIAAEYMKNNNTNKPQSKTDGGNFENIISRSKVS
ncbi:MAG: SpaA isopeptide-forming pilin-related protein, partial [Eubacterium sp.]